MVLGGGVLVAAPAALDSPARGCCAREYAFAWRRLASVDGKRSEKAVPLCRS